MLTRRMLVAVAALAMLSSSTAFAGGGNGGAKSDPIIRIKNSSAAVIAAWINPDPAKIAILAAVPPPVTPGDITASGGVVVNPGQTHDFPVKVGVYTLAAAEAGADPTTAPQVDIHTAKGITYKKQYKGPLPGTLTNY